MGTKSILFIGLFALCSCGALVAPIFGALGYMGHYCVGPEKQWWAAPFSHLGIRYSFTLAALTALGMVLHWNKLRFGKFLMSQEKLILLFLGVVWLGVLIGDETIGRYTTVDHPSLKMTKVILFALMLSHVATNTKNLHWVIWVLVLGAMVLGMQAYDTPRQAFFQGRLETVGGPDFRDANHLAGFLGAMLFFIGAQFLRSGLAGRSVCFVAGAFAAEAIVRTRSRGAMIGVMGGAMVAFFLAPKKHRSKVLVGIILAAMGGFYLSDTQFRSRAMTIKRSEADRDASAQSRLEIWSGGGKMLSANPMGVGIGNFYQNIGRYAPMHRGRDAHSTFVRCACELGVLGITVFILLVANAVRILIGIIKRTRVMPEKYGKHILWMSYGSLTALAALLTYGLTGTAIYMEALWWMLVMPVCLSRAVDNLIRDYPVLAKVKEDTSENRLTEVMG